MTPRHSLASRRRTRTAVDRLSTLLNANLVPGEALKVGAAAGGMPGALLRGAERSVSRGRPLWLSMQRAGYALTAAELALVRAGERSGRLPQTMVLLSQLMHREAEARTRLSRALTYPVLLLVVTLAVVCILATYVLPSFASMYADAGAPLPWSTRVMLAFADFTVQYGFRFFLAAAFLSSAVVCAKRCSERVAGFLDRAVIALPVFGRLVRAGQRSRIYALLEALVGAGLDVDHALHLAIPAVPNRSLRAGCERMRASVRNGATLSRALAQSGIDEHGGDPALLQVAEATGDYASAFRRLSKIAEEQRSAWASGLLEMAEPAAVGIMAILVGAAVIAVYQPVLGSAALLASGIR